MNIWFRRFLVILTIGGGFLGTVMTANALFTAKNMPVLVHAIYSVFIGLYIYGIFAGIRLSEDARHYGHVLSFYALQIPFFSSPIVLYQLGCGLNATIALVGFNFAWMCRLGSDWQFAVLRPNSWGIGVNLFASAIVFALTIYFLSDDDESSEPGSGEDVNRWPS
jgi:hypothetical protein